MKIQNIVSVNLTSKLITIETTRKAQLIKYDLFNTLDDAATKTSETDTELKYEWKEARLQLTYRTHADLHFIDVVWEPIPSNFIPEDHVKFGDAHWFGGSSLLLQQWPLERCQVPLSEYVSHDVLLSNQNRSRHGGTCERLWFSDSSLGITVPGAVPLHVGVNSPESGTLSLRAESSGVYGNVSNVLKYTVIIGSELKGLVQFLLQTRKPSAMVDERMLKQPVWSTWARYKTDVDQQKVLLYADDILKHQFPCSQIEIDDFYTTAHGDWDFNRTKFPDPRSMVYQLHSLGVRVTCWIHPFINIDSKAREECKQNGYLVKNSRGEVLSVTWWNGWKGEGSLLDLTNQKAAEWFKQKLDRLRTDYGIDSFKFDAGETCFIPDDAVFSRELQSPLEFTEVYTEFVSQFGSMVEVRSAFRAQNLPIFLRMFDKDSRWGFDNGLASMIPHAILFSITGYQFCLPDMIGGNAYGDEGFHDTTFPEKELFIRWAQLTSFLPAMQYSIAPWQYDGQTTDICRKYTELHENVVAPIIIQAMKEAVNNGTPVIRPLWWLDTSEAALVCNDQFLVADKLLVAPIIHQGHTERDVYLPSGCNWKDARSGEVFVGGDWLKHVAVPITDIAYYWRQDL